MLEEEDVDPSAPFLLHVRQVHAPLPPKPCYLQWDLNKASSFSAKMLKSDNVGKLVRISGQCNGCLKRILEIKWHPDSPIAIKVWISARDNMDLRRNCVIFVILTIYSAGWKYCFVILQWAGRPVDFFNLSWKTWLKNSSFQRYQLYYREHVAV